MNVFIHAKVKYFHSVKNGILRLLHSPWPVASRNGTFHLSPYENILTIARIKTFISSV